MNERVYLSTGEVAKIVGVTKDTLFHYEKIGLFIPEKILENKYRYYSFQQIELLSVIVMLRELGMSLKEIKDYIKARDAQLLIQILSKEEAAIGQKIKALKKIQNEIKQKKERVAKSQLLEQDKIEILYQPEKYYVHAIADDSEMMSISKCLGNLINTYHQVEKSRVYEIEYIQYEENISQCIYTAYREVIISSVKHPRKMQYTKREAGNYLTVYHKGHWQDIGKAYRRLTDYVDSNGLTIAKQYYETDLVNQLTVSEYTEHIIQIQVRVIENPK